MDFQFKINRKKYQKYKFYNRLEILKSQNLINKNEFIVLLIIFQEFHF